MAQYSVNVPISFPVSQPPTQAILEITTPDVTRALLLEISFRNAVASQGNYALGRPPVAGIGPLMSFTPQPYDPADRATRVRVVTAWSNYPTVPTSYLRRSGSMTGVGGNFTWLFRKGLMIPASSSLALYVMLNTSQGWADVVLEI